MRVCCGVDMVEIERIKESIERYGEHFVQKIFTPNEINYCEGRKSGKFESYAARFAAKEAVSKALGTGFTKGVSLQGIELITTEGGKPKAVLYGSTRKRFIDLGGTSMDISLSHSKNHAMAFAVLLIEENTQD